MTTAAIRQKLITYLADADDSKVKAIYALLENDIDGVNAVELTDEQYEILEQERSLHFAGKTISYNRSEAMAIIRGESGR